MTGSRGDLLGAGGETLGPVLLVERKRRSKHDHHPRWAMNRRRAAGSEGGVGDSWKTCAGRRCDAFS
ncbi:hypothetical protein ACWF76_05740 [Streptomyces globisporus]